MRGLQQQALLRVHGQRLARADAEQISVEVGDAVEEPATTSVGGAGLVRLRVVQRCQVPPAVGGQRADRVPAVGEQVPQRLRGADTAGQPDADPDDGDGLAVAGVGLLEPALGRSQLAAHPLEVVQQLLLGR